MNDPSASGQRDAGPKGQPHYLQTNFISPNEFLIVAPTASSERGAGPEWQLLSLLTKVLRDS